MSGIDLLTYSNVFYQRRRVRFAVRVKAEIETKIPLVSKLDPFIKI